VGCVSPIPTLSNYKNVHNVIDVAAMSIKTGYCSDANYRRIIDIMEAGTGLQWGFVKPHQKVKYCVCVIADAAFTKAQQNTPTQNTAFTKAQQNITSTFKISTRATKRQKVDLVVDCSLETTELRAVLLNSFYAWIKRVHPAHTLAKVRYTPVISIADLITLDTYASTIPACDRDWANEMLHRGRQLLPVLLVEDYL
jgi:hypothetical protein